MRRVVKGDGGAFQRRSSRGHPHSSRGWRRATPSPASVVPANGPGRRMHESAYQLWQGDRILEERFFYDPAQMRG
jgi:hypothetical protein